jgi:hypothetical protein
MKAGRPLPKFKTRDGPFVLIMGPIALVFVICTSTPALWI